MATQTDNKSVSELHLLYQDAVDNIREYKRQQWSITNYGVLLYVAIVALHEKFNFNTYLPPSAFEKSLLGATAVVILIVGISLICRSQCAMAGCRRRMKKIRDESFEQVSKDVWKEDNKPDHVSVWHSSGVPVALVGVLLVGCIAVWWVIFRAP